MNFSKFIQWLKLHGAFATLQEALKFCRTDLFRVCKGKEPAMWLSTAIAKINRNEWGYEKAVTNSVVSLCRREHRVMFNLVEYDFDFKHLEYLWRLYLYRHHANADKPKHVKKDNVMRVSVAAKVCDLLKELERRQPIRTEMEKRAYFYRFEYGQQSK